MAELKPYPAYKDSGVEWIGEMPDHWRVIKLKRFFKVINGKEIDEEVAFDDFNAIKVYGSGGAFKKTNKVIYDDESVLFGRKGTIGKPIYVNQPFWTVDTMYYTKFLENSFPKWFYYLLYTFPWELHTTNTALPSIVGTDIENEVCAIPDYKEQKEIANYLDDKVNKIDALIADKERLIALLEEKRQAVITETVTKGLDPNVNMKDSGIEWIGEVPEHWSMVKLKYYLKVRNGKEIETELSLDDSGAVDVYGSGGVFKKTDSYLFDGESVLFGRKGTIGKPIYVNQPFWTVDTMYYTEFYSNAFPKWFYYVLSTFPWDIHTTNTALPSLVGSDVENELFAIPEYKEQKEISRYLDKEVSQINDVSTGIRNQISKLKEYRESLIYEAVTGKIDVRDDAVEKEEAY